MVTIEQLLQALELYETRNTDPSWGGSPSIELFSDGSGEIRDGNMGIVQDFGSLAQAITQLNALTFKKEPDAQ